MLQRRFGRTPGGVSSLGLHVLWCPKYRRRILGGRIALRLSALLEQVADERGWQMVGKEVMPDHMPLLDVSESTVRLYVKYWWVR